MFLPPSRAALRRKVAATIGASALLAAGTLVYTPVADALPPSGAATSNTPGTSSDVWPTTIAPCDTLSWSVTGFAPNKVVNVKIDDGIGYGDESQQGTGVVSQAMADDTGAASGSFEVPCGIRPGKHWLRILATGDKYSDDGAFLGNIGFTNRSPDWVVEATTADNGTTDTATRSDATGGDVTIDQTGGAESGTQTQVEFVDGAAGTAPAPAVVSAGGTRPVQQAGAPATTTRRVVQQAPAAGGQAEAAPQVAANAPAAGSRGNANKTAAGKQQGLKKATGFGASSQELGGAAAAPAAALTADGTQLVVAQPGENTQAPMIGLLVGGSILIVGFAAIAAYLYVQRKRMYVSEF